MEKSSETLVSVIIPVYNGSRFIIEALQSVKDQTHRLLECIIVDDGSTDDTGILVQQWTKSDNRFYYIRQDNKGLSFARNVGLSYAKGGFIQFLDADDVLMPSKIEKQLNQIIPAIAAGDMVVSYTDYAAGKSSDIFEPSGFYRSARFKSTDYLSELIDRWESDLIIPPNCFLFTANIFFEKKIQFDTDLTNHEDFDCWLNIFSLSPRIKYLDEKLCIYRITDGSMSKRMKLMGEGFLQVLNKHIQLPDQPVVLKKQLIKKRREVLKGYNRIDLMTFKEKLLSIGYISRYYRKRILQKTGVIP